MPAAKFHPLHFTEYPPEEMIQHATDFRLHMQRRRTVRHFADKPVPREITRQVLGPGTRRAESAAGTPTRLRRIYDARAARASGGFVARSNPRTACGFKPSACAASTWFSP